MIYTVTLNPSIDYIVRLDQVQVGSVNRMDSDDKFAGGKGINVSRVLKRLDIPNTATGFIGGLLVNLSQILWLMKQSRHVLSKWQKIRVSTLKSKQTKKQKSTETGPNVETSPVRRIWKSYFI